MTSNNPEGTMTQLHLKITPYGPNEDGTYALLMEGFDSLERIHEIMDQINKSNIMSPTPDKGTMS